MTRRTINGMDASEAGRLDIGTTVLGAMTFGSQVDQHRAEEMVALARDAGVRMFDTSNNYNGGLSEEILGRAVAKFRDEVLISTKVGSSVDQGNDSMVGLSRRSIEGSVEASLRRLGTDYIDVYFFHRPDRATSIDESLEAIDGLVASGKVRYVGQSNFAAWQVAELRHIAGSRGWPKVEICQVMYNLLARRVEHEYVEFSDHYGLTNIAYNPLAGGLLTGKHRRDDRPRSGTRFDKEMYRARYWNAAQFDAVDELSRIADGMSVDLVELALRWLRDQRLTDAILIGASSPEQLRSNLAALQGPKLSDAVIEECDKVWARLDGAAPDYNR
jgi:aryl-alcohol dehydrogenase-like predicted oxidoreductase